MTRTGERESTFQCHHCKGILEFPEQKLMTMAQCYHCGQKTLLTCPDRRRRTTGPAIEPEFYCNCTRCGGVLSFASHNFGRQIQCYHCGRSTIAGKSYVLRTTRIDTGTPQDRSNRTSPGPRMDPINSVAGIKKLIQALGLMLVGFNIAFLLVAIVPGGMEMVGALIDWIAPSV